MLKGRYEQKGWFMSKGGNFNSWVFELLKDKDLFSAVFDSAAIYLMFAPKPYFLGRFSFKSLKTNHKTGFWLFPMVQGVFLMQLLPLLTVAGAFAGGRALATFESSAEGGRSWTLALHVPMTQRTFLRTTSETTGTRRKNKQVLHSSRLLEYIFHNSMFSKVFFGPPESYVFFNVGFQTAKASRVTWAKQLDIAAGSQRRPVAFWRAERWS